MSTRNELIAATRSRYQAGSRAEKQRILDEFVAVSGYHRKYAIQLLGRTGAPASIAGKMDRRRYREAEREALITVWEAADRICANPTTLKPCVTLRNVPIVSRIGLGRPAAKIRQSRRYSALRRRYSQASREGVRKRTYSYASRSGSAVLKRCGMIASPMRRSAPKCSRGSVNKC